MENEDTAPKSHTDNTHNIAKENVASNVSDDNQVTDSASNPPVMPVSPAEQDVENMANSDEKDNSESSKTLAEIISSSGNDELKFSLLIGLIEVGDVSNREIVNSVLHLLVSGQFDMDSNFVIQESSNILLMLKLLNSSPVSLQAEIWSIFTAILKKSKRNLQASTEVGLVSRILEMLGTVDNVVADLLIDVLSVLCSYSITVSELKILFGLLKAQNGHWRYYAVKLLSVLKQMPQRDGPAEFFSFSGKKGSYISLPPIKNWPYQNGWTFSCWLRLDPATGAMFEREKPYLYCFRTTKGIGYLSHFIGNSLIVTSMKVKGKGFQHCVKFEFLPRKWYMVTIAHVYNRWSKSELRCYVDGAMVSSTEMSWAVSGSDPFDKCVIGSNSEGDEDSLFSGQMSTVYLFSEALSATQAAAMYNLGPGYKSQFRYYSENGLQLNEDNKKILFDGHLSSSIVFMYNPVACDGQLCLESSPKTNVSYFVHSPHALMAGDVKAIITHSVQSALHSLGGIQILFPLFGQLDCPVEKSSEGSAHVNYTICSTLLYVLSDLMENSSTVLQQMLQTKGFHVISYMLEKSSREHMTPLVLSAFLRITQYLVKSRNNTLLKNLFDQVLFNPNLWIHTDIEVQTKLYCYLATDFIDSQIYTSMRRVSSVLQTMHSLKYYYWHICPQDRSGIIPRGIDGPRPTTDEIEKLRSFMLLYTKQLILRGEGILDDELQSILNYLTTLNENDNLMDVTQLLTTLMAEHPASLIPAFDSKHGLQVVFKLLASDSEELRLQSLKLLGYFLQRSTSRRKETLLYYKLFPLIADRLMLNTMEITMRTYNTLFEILVEKLAFDPSSDTPHAEPDPNCRIENPEVLKVVATMIKQSEVTPKVMEVKKLFLSDLTILCQNNRENRRTVLQMSVWQDWLFSLAYVYPQNGEEQKITENVMVLFKIFLHQAIKFESGGWRVWIDTLSILHSKISHIDFKIRTSEEYQRYEVHRADHTLETGPRSDQIRSNLVIADTQTSTEEKKKPHEAKETAERTHAHLDSVIEENEDSKQEVEETLHEDENNKEIISSGNTDAISSSRTSDHQNLQQSLSNIPELAENDDEDASEALNDNTVASDTVPSESRDTEAVDTVPSESHDTEPTNTVTHESLNTEASGTVAGTSDDTATTDTIASESHDTVTTDTVTNKPPDTATTDSISHKSHDNSVATTNKPEENKYQMPTTLQRFTERRPTHLKMKVGPSGDSVGMSPSKRHITAVTKYDDEQIFSPGPRSAPFRIPEFKWSYLHQKLLSDLLFCIETDLQAWKSHSTKSVIEYVNSSEYQVYVVNVTHMISQLADNLITSCGGLLPLLAAATSASGEVELLEPTQGFSIEHAVNVLQRIMNMTDVLIFASSTSFSELESEKNMPSGGILRQCLRLVCTSAVRNCLECRHRRDVRTPSGSPASAVPLSGGENGFNSIQSLIQGAQPSPRNITENLGPQTSPIQDLRKQLQDVDINRLRAVVYRDIGETKPAQFIALAIVYFCSVLMVSKYRDIIEAQSLGATPKSTKKSPQSPTPQESPATNAPDSLSAHLLSAVLKQQTDSTSKIDNGEVTSSNVESRLQTIKDVSEEDIVTNNIAGNDSSLDEENKPVHVMADVHEDTSVDTEAKPNESTTGPDDEHKDENKESGDLNKDDKERVVESRDKDDIEDESADGDKTTKIKEIKTDENLDQKPEDEASDKIKMADTERDSDVKKEAAIDGDNVRIADENMEEINLNKDTESGMTSVKLSNGEVGETDTDAPEGSSPAIVAIDVQSDPHPKPDSLDLKVTIPPPVSNLPVIDEGGSLTERLETALGTVAPLLREIFVDFASFLSKVLIGSHGQEIVLGGLVTLKQSTSVVELVMLLCSQEWQNSLQKHAGLAFIELVNEGRLLAHATRDHIVRVANEAEFILNRMRAENVQRHAEFETLSAETLMIRREEEKLCDHLITSAKHRDHTIAVKQHDKILNHLTYNHGAWAEEDDRKIEFWKLDVWEDDSRRHRRLAKNRHGSTHPDATLKAAIEHGATEDAINQARDALHSHLLMAKKSQHLTTDYTDEELLMDDRDLDHEPTSPVSLSTPCNLISLGLAIRGTLSVTKSDLYFVMDEEDQESKKIDPEVLSYVDHLHGKWNFSEIRAIFSRLYLLQNVAIEIFMSNRSAIMFAFPDHETVKRVIYALPRVGIGIKYGVSQSRRMSLASGKQIFNLSDMMMRWQRREISNFDYLMYLNTVAGRTYNDLNQYPVFPWIIVNYDSDELDLSQPSNYRDLSKPIGALNQSRREFFEERYKTWEHDYIPPFHYGTHYSTAAFTLNWLIRLEPFTSLFLNLQGGKFDHANRMFFSFAQSWKNCQTDTSDVKELIPEFFYLPEMFTNDNRYKFGMTEDGHTVDDVVLPKWAKTADDFVRINRAALESEFVSCQLHNWIDLIFGYKQRGPEAVRALNVFYYLTYDGNVNLENMTDPVMREAVENQIRSFGQTPRQLMTEPHAPRSSVMHMSPMMFSGTQEDVCMIMKFLSNSPVTHVAANTHPAVPVPAVIAITCNHNFSINKCNPNYQPHTSSTSFSSEKTDVPSLPFVMDSHLVANTGQQRRSLGDNFDERLTVTHSSFITSADNRFIFACGFWDNSFRIFNAANAKVIQVVYGHYDVVTCLSRSECNISQDCYVVTGSSDCTVMLWLWSARNQAIISDSGHPEHPTSKLTLTGHQTPITCVAVLAELGLIMSGSVGGLCLLHTLSGDLLRVLEPPTGCQTPQLMSLSREAFAVVKYDHGSIVLYSLNGRLLHHLDIKDHVNIITLTRDGQYMLTGGNNGVLEVWRTHDLSHLYTYPTCDSQIRSVALSHDHRLVIAGLATGCLLVFNVDFNRWHYEYQARYT